MSKAFLKADWNNLIMANYVIDPSLLKEYIPRGTELDLCNGQCFVSLIGFMFENTTLRGFRIPFHVNFEEVNLRFYVRYHDNGDWKRGTVFIKEIVPKPAISLIANTLYHEHYITLPMQHYYREVNDEIELGYSWKYKAAWMKLGAVTEKQNTVMQPGSKEEFIAEHYWGYTKYNERTTFEYGVEHEPWLVHKVKSYTIDCDFEKLYGAAFSFLNTAKPDSVFMAKGSEIAVMGKRKV